VEHAEGYPRASALVEHTSIIKAGLKKAVELFDYEMEATARLATSAPPAVREQVLQQSAHYSAGLHLVKGGLTQIEVMEDEYEVMERHVDIAQRQQLNWRILACRVILGRANIDDAKRLAFRDILAEDPPSEYELRKELHELTEALTNMESAEVERGPLRSINLDKQEA